MGRANRDRAALLLVAAMAIVACRKDSQTIRIKANDATIATRDSWRPLGPGDVRIISVDSAIEVAVIGDSLVGGLGPSARARVKDATDTMSVSGSGFAASIEKTVKGAVASALDHELHFPIRDVSDIRYEDGNLQFYGTNGKPMHVFERSRRRNEPAELFRPEDANAFIAAFKARKH